MKTDVENTQENFPASMTDQELFDTVAKHLFSQGEPCTNGYGDCRYRRKNKDGSFDTKRCAIGRCFPDSEYSPAMEGNSINCLVDIYPTLDKRFHKNDHRLLAELQRVHDYCDLDKFAQATIPQFWQTTKMMKEGLRDVARRYNLDDSVLETLRFEGR